MFALLSLIVPIIDDSADTESYLETADEQEPDFPTLAEFQLDNRQTVLKTYLRGKYGFH